MLEIFKNPYVAVAVIGILDVFGIIGFIIYTIKKPEQKKKLKKIGIAIACFVLADAVISFFIISSNTVYDRNGNRYVEKEKLAYYDKSENVYHIEKNDSSEAYMRSENGLNTFIAERVYIDRDGYIVYDRFNEFIQKNDFVFTDSNSNEYYLLSAVKWDRHGNLVISK